MCQAISPIFLSLFISFEREREHVREGRRERENPKQAPHSQTWGSCSQTVRSGPEPGSRVRRVTDWAPLGPPIISLFPHWILTTTPWGRRSYYPNITVPEMEAEIKYFVHGYVNDVSRFQKFALNHSKQCLLAALTSWNNWSWQSVDGWACQIIHLEVPVSNLISLRQIYVNG